MPIAILAGGAFAKEKKDKPRKPAQGLVFEEEMICELASSSDKFNIEYLEKTESWYVHANCRPILQQEEGKFVKFVLLDIKAYGYQDALAISKLLREQKIRVSRGNKQNRSVYVHDE